MTSENQFQGRSVQRIGSPTHLAIVTPDDTTDLGHVPQMIYVGVAGTLRVTTLGGETVATPSLQAGWHPLEICRIHATGTTATDIMVAW
ncbi:phage protein [Celeribacter baekdonensis B30]|uniref:Phage protein n=2 Tax=Celeribacter baekdonensis TaxID=875171 RepID=K2JVK4_9RHOB|nr:phage protein [Celeribacter baekdonensis B30]